MTSNASFEQKSENQIPNGFVDNLRPMTNILILGGTGVGKSTFINGLVNYLSFESMEEAKQKGFHVLVPAATAYTDDDENMQQLRVEVRPTIKVERTTGHDEDEDMREGKSATQNPRSYVFSLGPPGQERQIRIIDTPGVGDTGGAHVDQRNFTKILNFIADFDEIHAILLLLEPNKARMDWFFRYCLNELLTHLHVSAARNILFCFTKARQTFYRPGETLGILKVYLDELYQKTKIEVPLNEFNIFTFDNESFRFLCAWSQGCVFGPAEVIIFRESWNRSVKQTFKVLDQIKQLPPHKVSDTLSVNNTRLLISTLARPLVKIARYQLINVNLIKEKKSEIVDYISYSKDFYEKLYVETLSFETEELDQPITVCTHEDCVEYKQVTGGLQETIFKTECHSPCICPMKETSIYPNHGIKNCIALSSNIKRCIECTHSWQIEDPTIREHLNTKEGQMKAARDFLAKEEKQLIKLQEENEKIMHYCAHFAAFLKKHSIVPYNDAYLMYLEDLIREEKEKIAGGASDGVLFELETFKDQYAAIQEVFNIETDEGRQPKTPEEIYAMVEELKTLTSCGQVIQGVQNIEFLAVRRQHQHNSVKVYLNKPALCEK